MRLSVINPLIFYFVKEISSYLCRSKREFHPHRRFSFTLFGISGLLQRIFSIARLLSNVWNRILDFFQFNSRPGSYNDE
jgi:hypothetical protein